ncbi:regulatory protein RecX [Desulfonema magnum]|uniref:Regulatory protein RecX n=1 Tax=Desulfonema magnum TaxID=45655 RepID=A0A975GNU4_9BACT|nr:regulatory protein RecX [Desulfonema magnum]QTA88139.1 Regulatory protein [Desulfonema magnum]
MNEDSEFKRTCNKAMNAAVRLLSRRNHTKYEIRQKLKQRGFVAEVITKVISECEQFNYINDEQTAQYYLRELQTKGYGLRRIRFSMKKKGLNEELISNILEDHHTDADELENARRSLEKKLRTLNREKDARKRKEKIYRFLYSKGFSASVISELISGNI